MYKPQVDGLLLLYFWEVFELSDHHTVPPNVIELHQHKQHYVRCTEAREGLVAGVI